MADYSQVITSSPTNNAVGPSVGTPDFAAFLSSHPGLTGVSPTVITGDATLSGGFGFVGSNLNVTVDVEADDATVYVQSPSTVRFTGHGHAHVVMGGAAGSRITVQDNGSDVQSDRGDDTLIAAHGPQALAAGRHAALTSGVGATTLSGGFGSDSMVGGGRTFVSGGSTGADTLRGGGSASAHDTLYAGIGGDLVSTRAGHNLIYGNENDTIKAGHAQDTIVAGYAAETVTGAVSGDVFGGGRTLMRGGDRNTYHMTGSDTMLGSDHDNSVVTRARSSVLVDGGRNGGTGHIDVTLANSKSAHDTMFGGSGGLTIHVQQDFRGMVDEGLDRSGAHLLRLSSGQTLHVSSVTIDFNGDKHDF